MRLPLVITATFCALISFAQKRHETQKVLRNLEDDGLTYKGHLVLTDGTEDNGTLAYNEKTAVVSFKSDARTGTYNARNLVSFDFYDPESKQQRKFFSMEYEMRDGGQKTDQFFEIVRDYKDFALLIKYDPVTIKHNATYFVSPTNRITHSAPRIDATSVITVYLLSENLGIRPYLELQTKDVTHITWFWNWHFLDGTFTKLKMLDRSLPKELMGETYKTVAKYADQKDLDWDVKDDLIQIMDYYNSLSEN